MSFCCALLLGAHVKTVQAESFYNQIQGVLTDHNLMKMVDADVGTAAAKVKVQKAAWYPKVSFRSTASSEYADKSYGENGSFDSNGASVDVNQLVYDFGITSSRINLAEVVVNKELSERDLQRQNLLLAAVEAQLNLIKTYKTLEFSKKSEESIKNQAQLEKKRVAGGQGYTTDILQAKAQLAGAEARRIRSERDNAEAIYRYGAIFSIDPDAPQVSPGDLEELSLPVEFIPSSLSEVEKLVASNNPDIITADARSEVALATADSTFRKEYMPRLDLNLNSGYYNNPDENEGVRKDMNAELRFNWTFDLGMKARNSVSADKLSVVSSKEKEQYVRIQALEEARNAWNSWNTSKARTAHLNTQVEISSEFLRLARRERRLGRRSLLDILNGEVQLLGAKSNAVEAKIEETISSFRLLRAIGQLELDLFNKPGVVANNKSIVDATAYVEPEEDLANDGNAVHGQELASAAPVQEPILTESSDEPQEAAPVVPVQEPILTETSEGPVLQFKLEINGTPKIVDHASHVVLQKGDKLLIEDILFGEENLAGSVVNFKGFVGNPENNIGDDRGYIIDTAQNVLMQQYSLNNEGEEYHVLVTLNGNVLGKLFVDLESGRDIVSASPVKKPAVIASSEGPVLQFKIEINGIPKIMDHASHVVLQKGDKLLIEDILFGKEDLSGSVVNLKGFVGNPENNTGDDRGYIIDTAKEVLMQHYSLNNEGKEYHVLVTLNGNVLGKLFVDIRK